MPLYRISRVVVTDYADIEAVNPDMALALLRPKDVVGVQLFLETTIEEVVIESPPITRIQTTSDEITRVRNTSPSLGSR